MRDVISEFRNAMRAASIEPPDGIEADGKLHRFATNGKRGDDAGWFILYGDGIPAGCFGDWRTGISQSWRADVGRTLTQAEETAYRDRVEVMRRKREAEKARRHAEARKWAQAIWKDAQPIVDDHPYLVKKGVKPVATLREIHIDQARAILGYHPKAKDEPLAGRLLGVPVKISGELSTLELIDEAGRKTALAGGAKAGGYWAAQPPPDSDGEGLRLLIGEGVATVLSAHEATGYPVIAALSASNLKAVAWATRKKYPAATIILLADLVKSTAEPDHNAVEAVLAVHGLLAVPDFGEDRSEGATDFNDLHQHCGLEAVRRAISNARVPIEKAKATPHKGREEPDYHAPLPRPDSAMFYGLVGKIAQAGAKTTEANPVAVAMNYMTFLSANYGRDVYLYVGNTKHHARIYSLHVGRTGRGRKGEALGLVHRIRHRLEHKQGFLGQTHTGGLSSREGMVCLIQDPPDPEKGEETAEAVGTWDKRLWIVETEFANVLHQAAREGNTLSSALRDGWDGVSIKPATKHSKTFASCPHIALSAAITPRELLDLLKEREIHSGFLNRFLIFWAERERLLAFPEPTPDKEVEQLASATAKVISFAKGNYPETRDSRSARLSPSAKRLYKDLYHSELCLFGENDTLAALMERKAPYLLRFALAFAFTDLTLTIKPPHIEAALAWVRYWERSVRFIFAAAAREHTAEFAGQVKAFLKKHEEADRTDIIRKCFQGHVSATKIDEALSHLLADGVIKLEEVPRCGGKPGRERKVYKLRERDLCELCEDSEVRHPALAELSSHACELSEVSSHPLDLSSQNSQSPRTLESLMGSQSSQNSQSSQGVSPIFSKDPTPPPGDDDIVEGVIE
jgi:phage/plasmid primase-like uncharacterized protein